MDFAKSLKKTNSRLLSYEILHFCLTIEKLAIAIGKFREKKDIISQFQINQTIYFSKRNLGILCVHCYLFFMTIQSIIPEKLIKCIQFFILLVSDFVSLYFTNQVYSPHV
ncbi:unnamed protein product [Paramecium pentaurelia]|uniref:Transmembrane protein n=1 Tax=Paramecium pentaurelia TaxID=43138 RepID=A0A8S1YRI2_9CILI|nr:unnamed protein product [Paramecium pentaurelia]